jgi:hypothetical protein
MITDVVLICSVGTFCLALLDLLLSDGQKAKIGHWATKAWDFLDAVKRWLSRSPRVREGRRSIVRHLVGNLLYLLVALLVAAPLFWAFWPTVADGTYGTIWDHGPNSWVEILGFACFTVLCIFFEAFLAFFGWGLLAALYCLSLGLFLFIELILRRIAEHPKGPIIAASAGLAALAAVLKGYS